MKKILLFIAIYSGCFFVLSIIVTNVVEKPHSSNEMLSFVILGSIAYIVVGAITWIPINWLATKSESKALAGTIRFCLGLIVLNLFAVFADGKVILTLSMLSFDAKNTTFWVSLSIHCIYIASFFIASLALATKAKEQEPAVGGD